MPLFFQKRRGSESIRFDYSTIVLIHKRFSKNLQFFKVGVYNDTQAGSMLRLLSEGRDISHIIIDESVGRSGYFGW